jgi:hypothetical protein
MHSFFLIRGIFFISEIAGVHNSVRYGCFSCQYYDTVAKPFKEAVTLKLKKLNAKFEVCHSGAGGLLGCDAMHAMLKVELTYQHHIPEERNLGKLKFTDLVEKKSLIMRFESKANTVLQYSAHCFSSCDCCAS